jgi:hypothetical protein
VARLSNVKEGGVVTRVRVPPSIAIHRIGVGLSACAANQQSFAASMPGHRIGITVVGGYLSDSPFRSAAAWIPSSALWW